jgi:hypothetical protein
VLTLDASLFLQPQLISHREHCRDYNGQLWQEAINTLNLDVNCLLFLSSYNENFTVFTNFSKNPKYEVSLKSVCWKFLSSMWMDKHDKAYRHYLPLFCESA